MSNEIKRERSPNFPKMPLEQAIETVSRMHKKAGKSKVQPAVAAAAIGYGGINGAALTTIGALSQYGLIDREKTGELSVSQLALRVIHPVNEAQSVSSLREASLRPKVYSELFTGGFQHCDENLIANHLIQLEFTPDGAKKAAAVFKANVDYAKLRDGDVKLDSEPDISQDSTSAVTPAPLISAAPPVTQGIVAQAINKKVLASYSVPLGSNEVQIVFTGEQLRPEDFDALADYVALFKKQYQRKLEAEASVGAHSMKDVQINLANMLVS